VSKSPNGERVAALLPAMRQQLGEIDQPDPTSIGSRRVTFPASNARRWLQRGKDLPRPGPCSGRDFLDENASFGGSNFDVVVEQEVHPEKAVDPMAEIEHVDRESRDHDAHRPCNRSGTASSTRSAVEPGTDGTNDTTEPKREIADPVEESAMSDVYRVRAEGLEPDRDDTKL
jgi:hypothetical protein